MEIKVEEKDGITKVNLIGDVYVEQADELMVIFKEIIKKSPREVVIDMVNLKSISSSGIGKIIFLYKGLLKKNGKVRITGVNETIMQIFKIIKLDKLMEVEQLKA